jgi:hypothetical protein
MQIDMHYYGTYALARRAGLKPGVCRTIATASQFVDDNAAASHIEFLDGGRIDAEATAHHVSDIIINRDEVDQRQVWVPFHFLPGNKGASFSERLLCREDSRIAREMIHHHLGYAGHTVGVCLIGITAHILADTFSHFGFSGVGSRRNKVDSNSFQFEMRLDPDIEDYLKAKERAFFRKYGKGGGFIANIKSWLAETVSGALGHGAVATYPDRPYLKWSFEYEYPQKRRVFRDNPAHFLKGCQALHDLFTRFGQAHPILSTGKGVKFNDLKDRVAAVIAFQGKKEDRIKCWRRATRKGLLGPEPFEIPLYNPETWLAQSANMMQSKNSAAALRSNLYRFYQAASIHRQFVLRELLPGHRLVVS